MALIRLKILSGEAKSGPSLAPVLGQHQINLMEFCKLFNSESLKSYQQGIPLSVKIVKIQNLSLKITINGISTTSLFVNFLNNGSITLEKLYDLYRVLLITKLKIKSNSAKRALAYSMFGSLMSMNSFRITF